jgi:hypothetical protein
MGWHSCGAPAVFLGSLDFKKDVIHATDGAIARKIFLQPEPQLGRQGHGWLGASHRNQSMLPSTS